MASILIIDDEVAIATAFAKFFRHDGSHVVTEAHTGQEGIEAYERLKPDLVLLDVRLPDMTGFDVLGKIRDDNPVVIMVTAFGDIPMAVDALHKGAENFLTKPVDLNHLSAAAERALEKATLRRMSRYLAEKRGDTKGLVFGPSSAMRELAAQLALLAASDRTTALIVGESGAGKGRVAELLHGQSPRASKPFVEVNCAALTVESLDSELFGVEAGPGDGSNGTRRGLFEIADGGTLFLDEIGDLDPVLQPKLLRVLEGKGFRRQPGPVEIPPNVRVIPGPDQDPVERGNAGQVPWGPPLPHPAVARNTPPPRNAPRPGAGVGASPRRILRRAGRSGRSRISPCTLPARRNQGRSPAEGVGARTTPVPPRLYARRVRRACGRRRCCARHRQA